MSYRVGSGFDAHRLVQGRNLILGGVKIPHEKGLEGHSDADCLAHAIADAILGAAAAGDMGSHFPSSDSRFQGADSLQLLREVMRIVRDRGYEVENIDATVIAERPRLAPHTADMRARLAEAMGVAPGAVSVKSKSTDGLGAVGRGEGIAALCTALLRRAD